MPKAERAPMGEPVAERIAQAWHEAEARLAVAMGPPTWCPPTWHGLTDEGRAFKRAVAQDLIDAGHIL